jgi:hypothetical protein
VARVVMRSAAVTPMSEQLKGEVGVNVQALLTTV